jgi:hypothetical protein
MNPEIENILNQIKIKSNGGMLGNLAEYYKADEAMAKQLLRMCVEQKNRDYLKDLLGKELLTKITKVHKAIQQTINN